MHDSVLASVTVADKNAEVHFSKIYIHQSDGIPGRDGGTVWVQEALLCIADPQVVGQFSQLPVTLKGGRLILGDVVLENILPSSLRYTGAMELMLEPMSEPTSPVRFKGNGAELHLPGEAKYLEEFPGQ